MSWHLDCPGRGNTTYLLLIDVLCQSRASASQDEQSDLMLLRYRSLNPQLRLQM